MRGFVRGKPDGQAEDRNNIPAYFIYPFQHDSKARNCIWLISTERRLSGCYPAVKTVIGVFVFWLLGKGCHQSLSYQVIGLLGLSLDLGLNLFLSLAGSRDAGIKQGRIVNTYYLSLF
jgi:hypothetical protein